MDNTPIEKMVREELDKQFRKDLNRVLSKPEGRRLISYLLMDCGMRDSVPQGNSKDIFNAGRRAVAVQLSYAMDSIDWPHRTSGLESRLLAEKEYYEFQLSVFDRLQESLKQRKGANR